LAFTVLPNDTGAAIDRREAAEGLLSHFRVGDELDLCADIGCRSDEGEVTAVVLIGLKSGD
jgi:hypothetical protein